MLTQVITKTTVTVYTTPDTDPYVGNQTLSTTTLWIAPESNRAGLRQDYRTGGSDMREWKNLDLARDIEGYPHPRKAEKYLNSKKGQNLLSTIIKGHSQEWDGHNMLGQLSASAESAVTELISAIEALPSIDWACWDVADYLQHADLVTAKTTDKQIQKIVAQVEREAKEENIILDGDIEKYLTEHRDMLRDE